MDTHSRWPESYQLATIGLGGGDGASQPGGGIHSSRFGGGGIVPDMRWGPAVPPIAFQGPRFGELAAAAADSPPLKNA